MTERLICEDCGHPQAWHLFEDVEMFNEGNRSCLGHPAADWEDKACACTRHYGTQDDEELIADCQADARRDEQAYRELRRSEDNG